MAGEHERSNNFERLWGPGGEVGGARTEPHDPSAERRDRARDRGAARQGRQDGEAQGLSAGQDSRKVVRKYYGGQVREEVLSDVIRSSYSRAIAEQKLNPAGGPRIEPLSEPGSGGAEHFSYRATFEVYPEIALHPLDKLAVDVPKVTIEGSDVDAMIEKLRAQRTTWRAVERTAAANDRAIVDFDGKIDGEPFQRRAGPEMWTIVIGSGQVLADFDKALHGAAAGDTKTTSGLFPRTIRPRPSPARRPSSKYA